MDKYYIVCYKEIGSDGYINYFVDFFTDLMLGKNYLQWQSKNVCNRGAWLVSNGSDFLAIPGKDRREFQNLLKAKLHIN